MAGNGLSGGTGDGQLATQASFKVPDSLAIAADGALYIGDSNDNRVRRVGTDGIVTTFAGYTNAPTQRNEGDPATKFWMVPTSIALGPDGTLYVADQSFHIRRIDPNGRIYTVPGIGDPWRRLEGGDALINIKDIAVSRDGALYVLTTYYIHRLVDGQLIPLTGDSSNPPAIEGGRALASKITPGWGYNKLVLGVSDGKIRLVEEQNVFALAQVLPGLNDISTVIKEDGAEQVHVFDLRGRHIETRDVRTNAVVQSFEYDGAGYLVRIRDEAGNATTIERDANGVATAVVGPFGQRTGLVIDSTGYLRQVQDPAGFHVDMTYDANGLLTQFTDARSNTSQMVYDALGRITHDTNASSATISAVGTGNPRDWSVAVTTPEGRTKVIRQVVGSDGLITSTNTRTDGTVVTSVLNGAGLETTSMPDGMTVKVTPTPDPLWKSIQPLEKVEVTTPSGLTNVTSETRSVVTDPNNKLLLTEEHLSVVVNGRVARRDLDSSRTYTSTSPVGRFSKRRFDTLGRTDQVKAGNLLPITYGYDSNGRISTVTQGTRTTSLGYYSSGDVNGYLSQLTNAANQTTAYTPDVLGRPLSETLGTATTSYGWDENGNLTAVTPPGKPVHQQQFTPSNLLDTYSPPAAGIAQPATHYGYNLERQPVSVTAPGGVAVGMQYDAAGRLSRVTTPNGNRDYAYYPPGCTAPGCSVGHLAGITGPGTTSLSFTWDGELAKSVTWGGPITGSIGLNYDADFRVVSDTVTAASGSSSMRYGYDSDSLLTCVSPTSCSPAAADALTLAYRSDAALLSGTTIGTVTDSLTYNNYGELATVTTQFGAAALYSQVLDATASPRDALGRITRKTETRGATSKSTVYTYDLQGRLTDVQQGSTTLEHFEYDANGNRLLGTVAGTTRSATYDAQDRLLTYGPLTFDYTPNGELFTKTDSETHEVTIYHYDALGNLLSVDLPDGRLVEYVIDGQNRRIGKKIDGVLTKAWLYQNQLSPIAELDGSGNLAARYVYGSKPNTPDVVMKYSGGLVTTYRVITDHLGSPVMAVNVNNSSDVPFNAEYSAFGERTVSSGASSEGWMPFGFAGGLYDADTKLTRFGARDYDAQVGRWVSKDPILFDGGQTNLFVYVGNDPVNRLDPAGQNAILIAGAVVAAAAAATVAVGISIWWNQSKDDIKELIEELWEKTRPLPPNNCKNMLDECRAECVIYLTIPYPSGRGICKTDKGGAHGFQRCMHDCMEKKAMENGCSE